MINIITVGTILVLAGIYLYRKSKRDLSAYPEIWNVDATILMILIVLIFGFLVWNARMMSCSSLRFRLFKRTYCGLQRQYW